MAFTDFIEPRLRRLGYEAEYDSRHDFAMIGLDERCVARVLILSATAETTRGERVISCLAPAFPLPADDELAGHVAISLLRRNANLILAKWELKTFENESKFQLCADMIANTLDDEELRATIDAMVLELAAFQKELQKTNIDF